MSLPENMPSPGMDSPYILRLLFPDRNADRNARAFPGPGVFRSTTSPVRHPWGRWHMSQPPLGSLACGVVGTCESTTSGVVGTTGMSQPPLGSSAPGVNHPWGRWHVAGMSQPPLVSSTWGRRHRWHESTTSGVVGTWRQPPLGSLACRWHESTTSGVAGTSEVLKHQILIYIFFGMC